MIDLLLVHLPLDGMVRVPTGLLSIADWVGRQGRRVRVHDMRLYSERINQRLLAQAMREARYVGVGFMTRQAPEFLRFLSVYGEIVAGKLFVGGIHPTLFPDNMENHADDVCRIEGESFAATRLDCGNGQYDVERSEIRDLSLIDAERYANLGETMFTQIGGSGHANVETARGCNHKCAFCVNQALPWGRPWKARPVDVVVGECLVWHKAQNVTRFTFDDEHYFHKQERAEEIAKRLHDEIGERFRWAALATVRDVTAAPDLFRSLAERHGLTALGIGIEAGTDEALARLRKPHTVAKARECAAILDDIGVHAVYSYISGIPGERPETDQATRELMLWIDERHRNSRTSPPGLRMQLYRPLPGTPLAAGVQFPSSLYEWSWLLEHDVSMRMLDY